MWQSVSMCARKRTIRLTAEAIRGLQHEVSDHLLALELRNCQQTCVPQNNDVSHIMGLSHHFFTNLCNNYSLNKSLDCHRC